MVKSLYKHGVDLSGEIKANALHFDYYYEVLCNYIIKQTEFE